MTTIVAGMTPAQFITAVNGNFGITETNITLLNTNVEVKTILDDNYDYIKNIVKELPIKISVTVGMSGRDFIAALNSNFQEIHDADSDNDDFDLRFTLSLIITTTGINQLKCLCFYLHPVAASVAPLIHWDDGTPDEVRAVDPNYGWDLPHNHTFASGGTYNVTIRRSYSIKEYDTYSADARYDYQQIGYTQFALACPNIEHFYIGNPNLLSDLTGDFTNLISLKWLKIDNIPNVFVGDFSGMTNLEYYVVQAAGCHFTGSINNWNNVKVIYLASEDSFTGDVSNIASTIETFESYEVIPGTYSRNMLRGSLNGATNLCIVCFYKWVDNENKITCNIDTCPSIIYMSDNGCLIWSGTITGRTDIVYIGAVGLTGSPAALEDIGYFYGTSSSTMDKPIRMDKWKYIDAITLSGWTYTAAEVNQLLADLWANKDSDRSGCVINAGYRCAYFNFEGIAAPTGQGITDKNNLNAYRTPNNDPLMPLWNIVTN